MNVVRHLNQSICAKSSFAIYFLKFRKKSMKVSCIAYSVIKVGFTQFKRFAMHAVCQV